jgi:hypothetical protein
VDIPKIGKTSLDIEDIGRKDAFHVPGTLVISNYSIKPGEKVSYVNRRCTLVAPSNISGQAIHAIADPFLMESIPPRAAFWAFPLPELVSNFVHDFSLRSIQSLISKTQEITQDYIEDESDYGSDYIYDDNEDCSDCYS